MDPALIGAELRVALGPGDFGAPLEVHEVLSSTNDRARTLAEQGAPHGAAVLALAQSAGRGRRGRSWASPPGRGLYVSFVLRPSLPRDRLGLLALGAAVAAERALAEVAGRRVAGLKWPNDLLSLAPRGRKLGGVLVETTARGRALEAVVGVGLNLGALAGDELASIAIGLADLGVSAGLVPTFLALARALGEVERALAHAPAEIQAAFTAAALGIGEPATIGEPPRGGVFLGLADDGSARFWFSGGAPTEEERLHGGERVYAEIFRFPWMP